MQDIEADEDLDDDEQIRKLLRNRPPSLVLLAAHRMIGICGNVGEHTASILLMRQIGLQIELRNSSKTSSIHVRLITYSSKTYRDS